MTIRAITGFTLFVAILIGIFAIAAHQQGNSIVPVLPEVVLSYGVAVILMTAWGFIGRGKKK